MTTLRFSQARKDPLETVKEILDCAEQTLDDKNLAKGILAMRFIPGRILALSTPSSTEFEKRVSQLDLSRSLKSLVR